MAPPVVLLMTPPLMVNTPLMFPSAVALLMFRVPAFNVVPPVNELAPVSVSAPAPDFVKLKPPEITPRTVRLPAFVVTCLLAVSDTAPVPRLRFCEPIKVKSPAQL